MGRHWQLKIVSVGQGICLPVECVVAIKLEKIKVAEKSMLNMGRRVNSHLCLQLLILLTVAGSGLHL